MKVEISVTCRVCGREFEPSPEDIKAGRWHVCPACRNQDIIRGRRVLSLRGAGSEKRDWLADG